jgi:alpha-L-arabinofuranosidase
MKTHVRILSSFRFPLSMSSHPPRSIHGLAVVLATSVVLVAAPLSACGGAAPSRQLRTQALVTVNASNVLLPLPSTAFGINTAVWDDHLLDANLPGLLSAAGVNVLRYPGGSTSDVYHWQSNTIVSGQPGYANPGNTFDAFMGVVQAIGAQAMITINYGSGTPQEAASWVQYANKGGSGYRGPVPTYAGGSSTGHTYGIRYWEIGNEVYGNGTYGGTWEYDVHVKSPTTYAKNVVAYSQVMKAVDPSIKVGVMLTTPDAWPDGQTSASSPQPWNTTVLPIACSSIDFVIAHWYAQDPGNESDAGLLAATRGIAGMVSSLRSQIKQYCGSHGSSVQIMITETNSVSSKPGKQAVSLVNALFLDDSYMNWLEQGVANVDWYTAHGGAADGNTSSSLTGSAQYGDYGVLSDGNCASAGICEPPVETPFPAYYGLQMLTHLGQTHDTMVKSLSGNRLVAVHAVKQVNGHLAVMVINTDPHTTYDVTVLLRGFSASASATVYRYGEKSTAITASAQAVSGSSITVSLPPYSMDTVVFS